MLSQTLLAIVSASRAYEKAEENWYGKAACVDLTPAPAQIRDPEGVTALRVPIRARSDGPIKALLTARASSGRVSPKQRRLSERDPARLTYSNGRKGDTVRLRAVGKRGVGRATVAVGRTLPDGEYSQGVGLATEFDAPVRHGRLISFETTPFGCFLNEAAPRLDSDGNLRFHGRIRWHDNGPEHRGRVDLETHYDATQDAFVGRLHLVEPPTGCEVAFRVNAGRPRTETLARRMSSHGISSQRRARTSDLRGATEASSANRSGDARRAVVALDHVQRAGVDAREPTRR